jgi:predicted dehydrogenase
MPRFVPILPLILAVMQSHAEELKLGLIGLDTSHVVAFTKILNDKNAKGYIPGAKVVAAFKGGSDDIKASHERIDRFTKTLKEAHSVKLYPTIAELCQNVDAILLESVDGRRHLEQAREVILAGKILYIDKPLAASLEDAISIYRLAAKHKVPLFSSSSLRWGKNSQAVRNGSIGRVTH